jgi:hypothetical protein
MKTVYINPNAPVEFKPTKSAKKGREFVPSEPSGKHSKFGYCHYLKKWVRRDSMMGINARFYDADSNQTTVRLRLSEEGWKAILEMATENEWDKVLKSKEEIISEGLDYEDNYDD